MKTYFRLTVSAFSSCIFFITTILSEASELQNEADSWHSDHQQPSEGISLGALNGDERVYAAAGRMRKDGELVNEHTLYEIGSITKVFTGILLADTVLKGKATLDDSIGNHLPSGVIGDDSPLNQVTLRQLSTHTSGLPRLPSDLGEGANNNDPYAHYSRARLFQYLGAFKQENFGKPGVYSYSNLGVGLLGEILGVINDTEYETLLNERILTPLEMESTWVQKHEHSEPDRLKERFTTGHFGGEPRSHWRLSSLSGAGGIVSSVSDLLDFAEAHWSENTPEHLKDAFALAMKNHTQTVGLGWHIKGERFQHNGGTGGFSSNLTIVPGEKFAKVNLRNSSGEGSAIERRGDFSKITGFWVGTLDTGKRKLRLVMHVTESGNADHYSIDQSNVPISNAKASFEDGKLTVSYPGIRANYKAVLENGRLIGEWKQSEEHKLDMEFSAEMPEMLAEVFDRTYSGDLEPLLGFWRGRIGDSNHGLFVYFEVSKISDHVIAKIWSPTQTPLPIGVSKLKIDSEQVTLESRLIKGSFNGQFDPGTKTITGTWLQGQENPLTLTWSKERPNSP